MFKFNPITMFKAAVKGVSAIGQGVGKAQRILAAWLEDDPNDPDDIPESQEAIQGLGLVWDKFTGDTIPAVKESYRGAYRHIGEYVTLFKEKVIPPALYVFHAARKAAMDEEKK